jgi:hypothetical protein
MGCCIKKGGRGRKVGGIYSEKGREYSERREQKGIETWMYIYRENTELITYIIHISYTSKTFFSLYIFFPPEEK